MFLNDGLTLVPRDNLIYNIGFDGSGEHCPDKDIERNDIAQKDIDCFPSEISENVLAAKKYRDGCMKRRPNLMHRLYYRARRCVKLFAMRRDFRKI